MPINDGQRFRVAIGRGDILDRESIDIESLMIEDWICQQCPFEYEYRFTEYEYEDRFTEYEDEDRFTEYEDEY
jgi:hypothetical protein